MNDETRSRKRLQEVVTTTTAPTAAVPLPATRGAEVRFQSHFEEEKEKQGSVCTTAPPQKWAGLQSNQPPISTVPTHNPPSPTPPAVQHLQSPLRPISSQQAVARGVMDHVTPVQPGQPMTSSTSSSSSTPPLPALPPRPFPPAPPCRRRLMKTSP